MIGAKSFDRLFRGGALERPGAALPELRAQRSVRLRPASDSDELRGKVGGGGRGAGGPTRLSKGLDERLGAARRFGFRSKAGHAGANFDQRQRAIVKIHFFGHGGGGGAALLAHARYVAREAAARDREVDTAANNVPDREAERSRLTHSHADDLSRGDGARGPFFDGLSDSVDGAARMSVWADEDKRHFRIILAPEKGAELGDLKPYARAVMERAEAILATRLEWVAVNHYDTDNPHTHIVLRGRRGDGKALLLPRDFVKHGLRDAARDVATDRLGYRTRADERLALEREARAHRPTRLDTMIARNVPADGLLRIAHLGAPNGDADLTNALKARARELQRLGLASELRRNVLELRPDWQQRLQAMELHLDVRKRLMRERGPDKSRSPAQPRRGPER